MTPYEQALSKVFTRYGAGYATLSDEQRRNAVAFEVMAVATAQDERVSAETIRKIIEEAYATMVEAFPVYA